MWTDQVGYSESVQDAPNRGAAPEQMLEEKKAFKASYIRQLVPIRVLKRHLVMTTGS